MSEVVSSGFCLVGQDGHSDFQSYQVIYHLHLARIEDVKGKAQCSIPCEFIERGITITTKLFLLQHQNEKVRFSIPTAIGFAKMGGKLAGFLPQHSFFEFTGITGCELRLSNGLWSSALNVLDVPVMERYEGLELPLFFRHVCRANLEDNIRHQYQALVEKHEKLQKKLRRYRQLEKLK